MQLILDFSLAAIANSVLADAYVTARYTALEGKELCICIHRKPFLPARAVILRSCMINFKPECHTEHLSSHDSTAPRQVTILSPGDTDKDLKSVAYTVWKEIAAARLIADDDRVCMKERINARFRAYWYMTDLFSIGKLPASNPALAEGTRITEPLVMTDGFAVGWVDVPARDREEITRSRYSAVTNYLGLNGRKVSPKMKELLQKSQVDLKLRGRTFMDIDVLDAALSVEFLEGRIYAPGL